MNEPMNGRMNGWKGGWMDGLMVFLVIILVTCIALGVVVGLLRFPLFGCSTLRCRGMKMLRHVLQKVDISGVLVRRSSFL